VLRGAALAGGAVAVLAAGAPGSRVLAQRPGLVERRFEIVRVGDSTVSLLAPGEVWMRSGAYGIAVDPRQRDVLVARLRVLSRSADTAEALVTGQTTRLTTDYVAIFRQPGVPALRQAVFWGGVAAGLVAGVAAVLVLLRVR
jgi:hypothetical protein